MKKKINLKEVKLFELDENKRLANEEKYLDLLYDNYLKESAKYRFGIALRNQERKNRVREELPEDLTDFSKFKLHDDWYSDEESQEGNPNELIVKPNQTKAQQVDMFFEDIDDIEEEDDIKEMEVIKRKVNQLQKRKAEDELEHVNKKRAFIGPEKKPVDWISKTDNDESDQVNEENDEANGETDNEMDISENDNMDTDIVEEVPKDEFDYDSDEMAELLAMGEMSLTKAGKNYLHEKSINKYAFDDGDVELPRWFTDDENNNNKPQIPVTKEMVQEYKDSLKSINARNTKRVVEAKARKKKQLLTKMQKAKEKAKQIASNADMTEREKIKQIQKLYKGQLSNIRPNKVYVVGRKFTGSTIPKGNVRIKLVDPRMKKDKRGLAAAERRNKKKRKK